MKKVCKACLEFKEESEFPIHSQGKLRAQCNICWKNRLRALRGEKADKHRERGRQYYQKNKQTILEKTAAYAKAI